MGSTFRLILSVAIATLSLCVESDAYSMYNVSIQRQPQKQVEIIEVTLPQNTKNPYSLKRGTDTREEFRSEGEPKYEIFIKPNMNRQNAVGGRKIKIFVESEDFDNDQHSSNSSFGANVKQPNHPPMPLTIQARGRHVDAFQHSRPDKANSTGSMKNIIHDSKRDYKPNNGSISVQKSESKTVHTLQDIPGQVAVYGDDYISQQNEEREKRNKFRSNSERGSALSARPVEESRSSYVPVTDYKDGDRQIYRSTQREQSGEKPYVGVTEGHFREMPLNNQPSHNTGAEVKKVLVFEPHKGISVAKPDSLHSDRGYPQNVVSTREPDYSETRVSSGGRISSADEVRTDHGSSIQRYPERIPETRNPGRNTGEQTSYHETRPAEANNHYSRGATNHNLSNGQRVPDDRYSSDGKTVYSSRDRYPFDEETGEASISSTRSPYDIAPDTIQSNLGERPVRQSSYGGFPENYSPLSEDFSRPSTNDGSNSLSSSPCPNVFKYTSLDLDRWYATISVRTDEILTGLRLDIILDSPADIMTTDSIEVKTQDNMRFTVLSLTKRLVPGRPERVDIMVKFNADIGSTRIPYIKTIELNGRMICPSRSNSYPQSTTTRRPTYVFPADVEEPKRTTERNSNPYNRPAIVDEFPSGNRRTTSRPNTGTKKTTVPPEYIQGSNPDYFEKPNQSRGTTAKPVPNRPLYNNYKPSGPNVNDNRRPTIDVDGINPISSGGNNNPRPNDREKRKIPCGKPAVQPRPLITNGQMTTRGQWPWHVALYRTTVPDLRYICGGSLVSENHVITAAHCATKERTSIPMEPNMLLVHLGKHSLKIWKEQGGLSRDVKRITVHPDFNVTNYQADIAVLTLSQRVEYNDFIRPVCLWDKRRTHIDDIVGQEGTVVGWGYNEKKQLTEELKQAKMPVVSQNVCLWSYPEFFPKFTHNNTYCAGFKNGTSVCNGDSGGGMYFPVEINREEYWFLRGLVSLSASEKNDSVCDVQHYVVFADTAKYLPWLEDVLSRV